jgi:DNA-binding transcriptional ArsR family regulator
MKTSPAPYARARLASRDPTTCATFHAHPDLIARLQTVLIRDADVAALAETFHTLGDMTRVRILDALAQAELCVCDLAALLNLSESAVSHQLRLLRSLRLVRPRRDGRRVFYALDDQHVTRLFREGLWHVGEARGRAPAGPVQDRQSAVAPRQRVGGARAVEEEADGAPRGKVE